MWSTLREYLPLFILGYTGSSLLCSGFLSLQRVGTSHCGGFSCGARALGTWALSTCYSQAFQQEDSIVVAHGLSCSKEAQDVGSSWTRDQTPVSSALAGVFLATVPSTVF